MENSANSALILPQDAWYIQHSSIQSIGKVHIDWFLLHFQMQFCNVIIYSYHHLLDPKIAEQVSKELSGDCIVVFDEAHNIDNVCTESLSSDINDEVLTRATRSAEKIGRKVDEMEETDRDKLENEYRNLVQGLIDASELHQDNNVLANTGINLMESLWYFANFLCSTS